MTMNPTPIYIDATDADFYEGRPTDFFLCHTPLITSSKGTEGEYILQNEWPFLLSQVLKVPDEAAAIHFIRQYGESAPCLRIRHVVLRLSGVLADIGPGHTALSPEEVDARIRHLFPRAGHWYRLVVMENKKIRGQEINPQK